MHLRHDVIESEDGPDTSIDVNSLKKVSDVFGVSSAIDSPRKKCDELSLTGARIAKPLERNSPVSSASGDTLARPWSGQNGATAGTDKLALRPMIR